MRPSSTLLSLTLLSLAVATPTPSQAASDFHAGDRVLVDGTLHRKCSATVASLSSAGSASLVFDRPGCGDASQAYSLGHLQHLSFVSELKSLRKSDTVVLDGYFGGKCSGRVQEISHSGYVAIEFDALLCADTEALHRISDLTRITYVGELQYQQQRFALGQRVSTQGIHPDDTCVGQIRSLTNNGLAAVAFEGPACAYAGKLYSLDALQLLPETAPKSHLSGAMIFQRVMREIASAKKNRKQAQL